MISLLQLYPMTGGDDLEVRKKQLLDNGDCVIALPGE